MAVPNNRVGIHFIKLTTITFDALVHLVIPNLNQDGDFSIFRIVYYDSLLQQKRSTKCEESESNKMVFFFQKTVGITGDVSNQWIVASKILRAHYTAPQGKLVYNPSPTLPGPKQYGWK